MDKEIANEPKFNEHWRELCCAVSPVQLTQLDKNLAQLAYQWGLTDALEDVEAIIAQEGLQ